MKISAWQEESFIDYEGKISTLVFTPNCNYNCGYCHNPELKKSNVEIDEKIIFNYLKSKKGWIDAVVISGGEPTIQPELKNFMKQIKKFGLLIKLDTNGSRYRVLQELRDEKLVNYLAMDVKGPIELYPLIAGKKLLNVRDNISKGISLASQFPDYEFRTTICPVYENGKIRWMTPKEIGKAAELISDWALKNNEIKYFLQPFKAVTKEEGNKEFIKEKLPVEFHETPLKYLEECLVEAQKYIPNAKIR